MTYDRKHPFLASIKNRYSLCTEGSQKDTRHVVVNIEGSGIRYQVGDSLAIYPLNDPFLVERTLKILNSSGNEIITDRNGESYPFQEYLKAHVNLKGITRKFLGEFFPYLPLDEKKDLEILLKEENKEELKNWLHSHELWDLLERFPGAKFTPQNIVDLAMPLLPRFYSISSSQGCVGDEVHLTVAYLRYETRSIPRVGVCTHFLCELAPLNHPNVYVYLHPTKDFHLPEDPNAPIIMVGPGTGIAPFRAFMQERERTGSKGKNWLFFGEWTKEHEYFYEKEWLHWQRMGLLDIDLAFSRDQEEKVYVQHLMQKRGEKLFQWLEAGAVFYVCGNAHHMAKDVDLALHQLVQEHGKMSEGEAHAYIKRLKASKRYLRDVY